MPEPGPEEYDSTKEPTPQWLPGGVYAKNATDLNICTKCYCLVPMWFRERHLSTHA